MPGTETASSIRLLPRRVTERHTIPYTSIVGSVLLRRFLVALRVSIMCCVPLYMLLGIFTNISMVRAALGAIVNILVIMVAYKVVLVTELDVKKSPALEVLSNVLNPMNYVIVASFVLSAAYYFLAVLNSDYPSYYDAKVETYDNPKGIPESLALHRVNKWYVINEKHFYMTSYMFLISILYAVQFIYEKKRVLDLQPEEVHMRPYDRLVRRSNSYGRRMLWILLSIVVFPIFYFVVLRAGTFTPVRLLGTVQFSGFKLGFLALPLSFLPLFLLWDFTYQCFMTYLTLGPVHMSREFSSNATSDMNGCLINGLSRSYSSMSGLLAWSELSYIGNYDSERRKIIFNDTDNDRVVWLLIYKCFKDLIQSHLNDIRSHEDSKKGKDQNSKDGEKNKDNKSNKNENKDKGKHEAESSSSKATPKHNGFLNNLFGNNNTQQKSKDSKSADASKSSKAPERQKVSSDLLLLSSDASLIDKEQDRIVIHDETTKLYQPASYFEKKINEFAKKLEGKPDERAKKAQASLKRTSDHLETSLKSLYLRAFQSSIGNVFKASYERELQMKIKHIITSKYAFDGISQLVLSSLQEDEYGYVQDTVGDILMDINNLTIALEDLLKHPHEHIPGIDGVTISKKTTLDSSSLGVQNVQEILGASNKCFDEISTAFKPYFENLKIPQKVRDRVLS